MSTQDDSRTKFLLDLYNQLWNSINARINVSWQSIGILVSAFAVLALTENSIISLNYSSSIIVLIVGWYLAQIIDISYSYNRNQGIISNIERQFLNIEDQKLIHPYFISHRSNIMATFLKIQAFLGIGIALLVLILHFFLSVLPIIIIDCSQLTIEMMEILLPYLFIVIDLLFLIWLKSSRDKDYSKFISDAPGKTFSAKIKK